MWIGLAKANFDGKGRKVLYLGKSYDEGKTWLAYRTWAMDHNGSYYPHNFGHEQSPIYELHITEPFYPTDYGNWTKIFKKYPIEFIYKEN